jgi:hypothetical protein
MPTFTIVLIIITVIIVAATIALYFLGKRAEKKQDEQNAQLEANAQNVSMLIIDKKMLRIKDSGLPETVINQTPFYARRSKLPIVKAKVGPQIVTLICDSTIFDDIPLKREVKARVSGLYIISVRGLHGKKDATEAPKKKGLRAWALNKQKELKAQQQAESPKSSKKKSK